MSKLACGPIRQRRIAQSLWLPGLWMWWNGVSIGTASVFAVGCALAVRFALTRMQLSDGGVTIVNFFRTIRLPAGSVQLARFAPPRWHHLPVPLILVGENVSVSVSGVSAWLRSVQWPDQPFVGGRRNLLRVEQFFEGTDIVFDPLQPARPA